jgi:hypothetical protein
MKSKNWIFCVFLLHNLCFNQIKYQGLVPLLSQFESRKNLSFVCILLDWLFYEQLITIKWSPVVFIGSDNFKTIFLISTKQKRTY